MLQTPSPRYLIMNFVCRMDIHMVRTQCQFTNAHFEARALWRNIKGNHRLSSTAILIQHKVAWEAYCKLPASAWMALHTNSLAKLTASRHNSVRATVQNTDELHLSSENFQIKAFKKSHMFSCPKRCSAVTAVSCGHVMPFKWSYFHSKCPTGCPHHIPP